MHLLLTTTVRAPDFRRVMAAFDEKLFRALAPPFPRLRVVRFDGCRPGDVVQVEMDWGLGRQPWRSLITEAGENAQAAWFVDEGLQVPWPFRQWRHRHLIAAAPGGTTITEDLTFATPSRLLDWLVRPAVWALLAYRRPVYQRWFSK